MRKFAKAALGAFAMLVIALLGATLPASAYVDAGISFGFAGPGYAFDPCDYYDYYDQPPPWGLPPDYCEYPVYSEPVFYGGFWYRGPIYYRWYRGQRVFWLNGGWHADAWRGGARPGIDWQSRGGWNSGFRPGMRPGPGFRPPPGWRAGPSPYAGRPGFQGGPGWTGGERPFGGPRPWTGVPHFGGPGPWSGGRGPQEFPGGSPRGGPSGGRPAGPGGGRRGGP
jgi:hypothetical protein